VLRPRGELVERTFRTPTRRVLCGDCTFAEGTTCGSVWLRQAEARNQARLLADFRVGGRISRRLRHRGHLGRYSAYRMEAQNGKKCADERVEERNRVARQLPLGVLVAYETDHS
jgi:hypothetical protein